MYENPVAIQGLSVNTPANMNAYRGAGETERRARPDFAAVNSNDKQTGARDGKPTKICGNRLGASPYPREYQRAIEIRGAVSEDDIDRSAVHGQSYAPLLAQRAIYRIRVPIIFRRCTEEQGRY